MSEWPIYFKDRLTISNLDSPIVIATLWTPKEVIEKMVPAESYSLMGQFYTKKGINYIVRNILANPFITKIYLVGSDLMESGEAFIKFLENGVDEDYKIIGDETATIEQQISKEAIAKFRENIEVVDLRGAENLKKIAETIAKEPEPILPLKTWCDSETFEDPPKPQISTFPSELDLMKIRRPLIADAYLSVLKHINMFGIDSEPVIGYVSSSSNKMKELLNLSVSITEEDPKKWNVPEHMPFSKTDLDNYFKGFFDHDRGTEDYTYGERLFNYASEEIDHLKEAYPWLKIDRFQKFFPHGGIDQVAVSIIRKLKSFKYDKGGNCSFGKSIYRHVSSTST